jgi:hypothetical protein
MHNRDIEQEQTDKAATEAAAIGGRPGSAPAPLNEDPPDEAQRPLAEAGQGESEGFEEAESELVDHATHGDQHAARRVIEDAPTTDDDPRATRGGEADHEHSSQRPGRDA